MKEMIRYKTFDYFVASLIPVITLMFCNKEKNIIKVLIVCSIVLLIICLVLFLNEYNNSLKIKREGVFVLGILEKDSIKTRVFMKDLYVIYACAKYYDEQKKMELRFQGYDICSNWEVGFGKIKEIRDKDEGVEVLIGYLREDPKICELCLKEVFDRT